MSVSAPPAMRPLWQRARLWVLLAVLLGATGLAIALLQASPAAPLDPASPSHEGSRALSVLLGQGGVRVTRTQSVSDTLSTAGSAGAATVVVPSPEALSAADLQRLAQSGRRLVVLGADDRALKALGAGRSTTARDGSDEPECTWPGAAAAGSVAFTDALTYSGSGQCYGGRVVVTDRLVLIGSSELAQNQRLARTGVAALLINAISADGSVRSVDWLLPSGVAAAGEGSASVWTLFPTWCEHAVWWLLLLGVLLALWRGRRLGPVVSEPLPVVVRSTEVVEGHGRLYLRARARDRAAAALRAGTARRLGRRLGLPRSADPAEVSAAWQGAGLPGTAGLAELLVREPTSDAELVALADELQRIENTDDQRNHLKESR